MGQDVEIVEGCILNMDPATGELIAKVPVTSDIPAVVSACRAAQRAWSLTPLRERIRAISSALGLLRGTRELAETLKREVGKPMEDALEEATDMVDGTRGQLGNFTEAFEDCVSEERGCQTRVVHDPLGVVAIITPWNYPVAVALDMLIAALAAGNTVVFKPSEVCPLVGALIHAAFAEALPPGVIGLVQGDGTQGAAVIEAGIDAVGFTGSTETGRKILMATAPMMIPVVAEMGGKDPLLVFEDADLEVASDLAVEISLMNAGQICTSVERIYVARGVLDRFEHLVLQKAQAYAASPKASQPLVSAMQREKVHRHVTDAVKRGACLKCGGAMPPDGAGYHYPVTMLSRVPQDSLLMQEETFGPIIAITPFNTEEEAVTLSNDSKFGLAAIVATSDAARADRVARQLQVAIVGVNQWQGGSSSAFAAGHRASGHGLLFMGVQGLRQFTAPKSIFRRRHM